MKNKTCVIGICGGIAAYKICELVSRLKKSGCDVHVVMTAHAQEFITPLTLETLSGNPVVTDMFAEKTHWEVEHISLAKRADIFVVAPATANILAKYASGIADDFLSTTLLATRAPVLMAPAMNSNMYTHPAVTENIDRLKKRGVLFIEPATGLLACGDEGKGRLPEPQELFEKVREILAAGNVNAKNDLAGKTVLVTAGGTVEEIDAVRYIGNYSSGKMGAAICDAAAARGAKVILVAGNMTAVPDASAVERIDVKSTRDMYAAVMENLPRADIIIKAAAPADFRPETPSKEKIKKTGGAVTLKLTENPDIAAAVGKVKNGKKLVIFCAETGNPEAAARKKLKDKNADLVVANDVTLAGAGFGTDTNIALIIDRAGKALDTGKITKRALADIILDKVTGL